MCHHPKEPTMNIEKLKDALLQATQEFWGRFGTPLLLSNLPKEISERGIPDYKQILASQSLKSFVNSLAEEKTIQVVTHPLHKAKIGLIPAGEHYSFSQEEDAVKAEDKTSGKSQAVKLLDILSKLSEEELEKVNIPVSVLAKLHRKP